MTEFVEVKTQDLSGEALDWAVGYAVREHDRDSRDAWRHDWLRCYSPSTDWSDGGPLIDRRVTALNRSGTESWWAHAEDRLGLGPTALIAACRAIVASVLGDIASVPKELLP